MEQMGLMGLMELPVIYSNVNKLTTGNLSTWTELDNYIVPANTLDAEGDMLDIDIRLTSVNGTYLAANTLDAFRFTMNGINVTDGNSGTGLNEYLYMMN